MVILCRYIGLNADTVHYRFLQEIEVIITLVGEGVLNFLRQGGPKEPATKTICRCQTVSSGLYIYIYAIRPYLLERI